MPTRGPYETSPLPSQPRTLAERLRWLRKQAGLTQVELSAALGCEQAMVSSWEVGRSRPSAVTLGAIAKHYGVSTSSLDTGDEFMEEAARRPVQDNSSDEPWGDQILNLPSAAPGQVVLLDQRAGTQAATDVSDAMATMLSALKKGRKVWLVVK